jgi:hypothetical protein
MLEAVTADLVFTISLKRSTQNLQLSTSWPADYPIFTLNFRRNAVSQQTTFRAITGHGFWKTTMRSLHMATAGKIRIVTVLSPQRLSVLPDVPAASETYPGLVAGLSIGVFAPAATPKSILDQIAEAHRQATESADFEQKLLAAGLEPVHDTPEQAHRFLEAERARIIPLVKSLGFEMK